MVIRSPQSQVDLGSISPNRTPDFQGGRGAKFSTRFIDTGEKILAAKRRKDKERENRARNLATINYRNQLRDETIRSFSRLSNSKGEDIIALQNEEGHRLREVQDKLLSKIRSDWRADIQARGGATINDYNSRASALTNSRMLSLEKKAYEKNTQDTLNELTLTTDDPKGVALAMAKVDAAALAQGDIVNGKGKLGRTATAALRNKSRSALGRELVETQVRLGNHVLAKGLYSKAKDYMNPNDIQAAEAALKVSEKQMVSTMAFDAVEEARRVFPNSEKARDQYIREMMPTLSLDEAQRGAFYKEAASMNSASASIDKRSQDLADERGRVAAFDGVDKAIAEGRDPMTAVLSAPAKYRPAVLSYANRLKTGKTSDARSYNGFMNLYRSNPDGFSRINFRSYAHKLNQKDIDLFEGMKRNLINEDRSEKKERGKWNDKIIVDVVKGYAAEKGYDLPDSEAKLQRLVGDRWEQLTAGNPSPQELRNRVRYLLNTQGEKTVPRSKLNPFNWFRDDKKEVADQLGDVTQKGLMVNPKTYQYIQQRLKKAGRPSDKKSVLQEVDRIKTRNPGFDPSVWKE